VFELSNETILLASPPRVWTVLTRFEDYRFWHPYTRPAGMAAADSVIQYSFRINPRKDRFWALEARLTGCTENVHLAFQVELGWLLTLEERFMIAHEPVGSKLIHSYRCSGLLSFLRPKGLRRNFEGMLKATDRLIQRRLTRTQSKPPGRPRVRKGFRPDQS